MRRRASPYSLALHAERQAAHEGTPVLVEGRGPIGRAAILQIGLVEQVLRLDADRDIVRQLERGRSIELIVWRDHFLRAEAPDRPEIGRAVAIAQARLERPLLEIRND